jgi:hypothetical protein
VAFDSFLASFVYIKDPRQNRLYLGLEHLTEAVFKPTLRQPTPKLSIFETALIAAIWALTASYTLFFFLTLISIFNLVLLFRQALSTLTPRLIPPLATILKRVWPPHLLSLLTLASKPPLALRTFTLTRFIVFASFFVNLVKKNLRALVLGSKKPNPVASPFVVRVSKKVQRKAWPPYTDESGRLYFRRTLVGGVKTTPRRPSKVLGFLLLTLMVLLLPTEAVTKLNMLWPLAAAYLTLRVVFKVRPKILKLAQGCRSFGPRLRRCFFALRPWGLFGNKALGAKAGGATEAALLRLELLAGGALPKLRNLGLVWVRIKTTPRLMFL